MTVFFFHTGDDGIVGNVRTHSGARPRHCAPIGNVDQDAADKRPGFAHPGFHRVNCTDRIPENAIPVFSLFKDVSTSGFFTILVYKICYFRSDKCGYPPDILIGNICSAKTFAAFAAFLTIKNIRGFHLHTFRRVSIARFNVI